MYLKSSMFLTLSNLASTLIQLALLPIITRLYGKADIAIYSVANVYATFFLLLGTFGYLSVIVIDKRSVVAATLLRGLYWWSVIAALGLFLVIWLGDQVLLGTEISVLAAACFALISLGNAHLELDSQLTARLGQFTHLSGARFLQTAGTGGLQAVFGLLYPSTVGMLLGRVLAQTLGRLTLRWGNRGFKPRFRFSVRRMGAVMRKRSSFFKFNLPNSFLQIFNASVPVLGLSIFFQSLEILAVYAIADRVLNIPMNLYKSAVSTVYLRHAARQFDAQHKLFPTLSKLVAGSAVLALIGVAILFYFGDVIFAFALGEQWAEAGKLAGWFAVPMAGWILLSPVNQALLVLNRQKFSTYSLFADLCTKVLLIAGCLYWQASAMTFLQLVAIGSSITIFSTLLACLYALRHR